MKKLVPEWLKVPLHNILKKYTSVRADEIEALEKRLEAAERLLEFVSTDETNRWLYQNRLERMDATLDIFDKQRRQFHLERYRFAAPRVRGRRVLDCASGAGYGGRILRDEGNASIVICVEINEKAVEYASKKHGVEGTSFICGSGEHLPLATGTMDVVTSFETIEHMPDDAALVAEFRRILRPGGLLIISTPNQWPVATSPFHVREYDRMSFLKVIEAGFECFELYNQNSGTESPYNHDQPAGIRETTLENELLAECYMAVCRRKT